MNEVIPLFLVEHELERSEPVRIGIYDLPEYGHFNMVLVEGRSQKSVDFSYNLYRRHIASRLGSYRECKKRRLRMYVAQLEFESGEHTNWELRRVIHKEGAD